MDVLQAHVCGRRFRRLGCREERRGLVDDGRRGGFLAGLRDRDGRDVVVFFALVLLSRRGGGSSGVGEHLVRHGLKLQDAALHGLAAVDFDPRPHEERLRVDLPVGRLVRDDAHGKGENLFRGEGVGGGEGVLERRLGEEDDLVQRRELGLIVGGQVYQRGGEHVRLGLVVAILLFLEGDCLQQGIIVQFQIFWLRLLVLVLVRVAGLGLCPGATPGQDDELADALLLKLCPLAQRSGQGIHKTAALGGFPEELPRGFASSEQDIVVGRLDEKHDLLLRGPDILGLRPHFLVQYLLADNIDAIDYRPLQRGNFAPLRSASKGRPGTQGRLGQEPVVPRVDPEPRPRQAMPLCFSPLGPQLNGVGDGLSAQRRIHGVVRKGEKLDVRNVGVRRDTVYLQVGKTSFPETVQGRFCTRSFFPCPHKSRLDCSREAFRQHWSGNVGLKECLESRDGCSEQLILGFI